MSSASRSTSAMDIDYSEEYRQPRITIDKILIRGFLAIENLEVQFDKHTSLITGAKEVSLAIPEAIDFVLNSSYQDIGRALKCGNDKKGRPKDFFVTVHISANEEFELIRVNGKAFTVTRYLHEKRIGSVYIKRVGIKKIEQLGIEIFHGQLNQLQFNRINELVISERTFPTSFDLNNIFIDAMNLNAILDMMKMNESSAMRVDLQTDCYSSLMQVNKKRMDLAELSLMEIRTLEAGILTHQLNALKSNPTKESHIARKQQCKIIFQERVNKIENIQQNRFKDLETAVQQTLTAEWVAGTDVIKPFNESLDKFMAKMNGYMDGLKNDKMADLIRRCANQHVTIAGCKKRIDNAQIQLKKLPQGEKRSDGIIKNIEDRRKAVEMDMAKLKDLEQKLLDNEINRLKVKRDFVKCTNKMAFDQLSIDQFFSEQTFLGPAHINSWLKGFIALEKAKRDKIQLEFVGNVFDYINPTAKLNIVLPLLSQYFAMFFFKTEQDAATFEELAKPFLQQGQFVHTHVINDVDQERLHNLPAKYESLAKHVLSKETQAQHPLVKNWFDNFRVYTGKGKSNGNLALEYKCKIIDGNKCYHEDGGFSDVFNGKSDDDLQTFLEEWKLATIHRNSKLQEQGVDYYNSASAKLDADRKQHMEQRQSVKVTINDNLLEIARYMMNLVENMELFELIMDYEIVIEINQKMIESLEAGNATPQIELPKVSRAPKSLNSKTYIKEFTKSAKNIMDSFIQNGKRKLQLERDAIKKFKSEITAISNGLPALKTFDYKRQFNTMPEQQQYIEVDRKVHEHNMILKEIQAMVCKLGNIKKFPELLVMNDIDKLAKFSLEDLQRYKQDALDRSVDVVLPEPDADYEAFIANHDRVNEYVLVDEYAKTQTEQINANNQSLLVWAYFESLLTVLDILNKMVNVTNTSSEKEVFGIEVESAKFRLHVFHDTEEVPYDEFSLKDLCSTTGLFFINEDPNDSETIVTSNMTKVLHHRYALIFQMVLSIWMSPSLIILNNSIIGHPVDSLRKIIQQFQMVTEIDDLLPAPEFSSRQVIVVERPHLSYRELFNHIHKRIECINGMKVDYAYVTVDS